MFRTFKVQVASENIAFVDATLEKVYSAKITIVDSVPTASQAFKATGHDGPVTYSGVVCALDKPFEIIGKHPLMTFKFQFTAAVNLSGTMKYSTSGSGVTANGGGTYVIEGAGTEHPRIVVDTLSTASIPVKTTHGGGKATILLTPLHSSECK